MKKITIGIIAHVDSGKTTLSEAFLFMSGAIRNFGRVDKGESFLDSASLERERGITIFSKQARFEYGSTAFVLIDTPGHADFSAETERTLQILDYAILLISAADGVKGQTKTLWRLLDEYKIPTFIFVNKMDQEGADRNALMAQISGLAKDYATDISSLICQSSESSHSLSLSRDTNDYKTSADIISSPAGKAAGNGNVSDKTALSTLYEQISLGSEAAMNEFLETGALRQETIAKLISDRRLFPCLFGSALKGEGVSELLSVLDRYTLKKKYPDTFSAAVYKIAHADDGSRLTFIKITGGSLPNKSSLPDGDGSSKINEIRLYSGEKFSLINTASAGEICALTGLKESYAGERFGQTSEAKAPVLIPVLNYRLIPDESTDPVTILPDIRKLEEEIPELSVSWNKETKDIYVNVMGQVQLEILTSLIKERFGKDVTFDSGEVVYKETIAAPVIGVGHFEPLRHYAEVQLLLEPSTRGSGLTFDNKIPADTLSKNWQQLILTHLKEKKHRGVLTGAPITDIKITLLAGKAHLKHTEGGDFRQATYRAVRQGLMMAENILLEPYYRFTIELPTKNVGRAMNDLSLMHADFSAPELIDNYHNSSEYNYAAHGSASKNNSPVLRGSMDESHQFSSELKTSNPVIGFQADSSLKPDGNLHGSDNLQGSADLHGSDNLQGSADLHGSGNLQGSANLNGSGNLQGSADLHGSGNPEGNTITDKNLISRISGRGPVAVLKNYPSELASYTKGEGSISFITDGYGPCHDAEEIIAQKNYIPENDTANPADSVFCSGGAGHSVPYDEVYGMAHIQLPGMQNDVPETTKKTDTYERKASDIALGTDEINDIISGASHANRKSLKSKGGWKKARIKNPGAKYDVSKLPESVTFGSVNPARNMSKLPASKTFNPTGKSAGSGNNTFKHTGNINKGSKRPSAATAQPYTFPAPAAFPVEKADYLLVDGYNVIFAWKELSELAKENIDAARDSLIEILSKYLSSSDSEVIVVFDAYKVSGKVRENMNISGIRVVFTAENQTADQYIERFANEHASKNRVAVVTSDGTEQVVAMGQGCRIISSREFLLIVNPDL